MFTGVLTCRFAGAQLGVHAQLTSLSPESGKATFVVTGQARARKAEIAEMTEKKFDGSDYTSLQEFLGSKMIRAT